MDIFKKESETKRMIFNIESSLAQRLEQAKTDARNLGKKLDIDTSVNKALEKFLKKAEKKLNELRKKKGVSSDHANSDSEDSSKLATNLTKEDQNENEK